jgi:hypothetical protein
MKTVRWNELFCRVTECEAGTPRFSLKGAKAYLYEYRPYSGGHKELDRIIELLERHGIKRRVSGADSPMNVMNFEYVYRFEDGGFEIYGGNYLYHDGPPGHGAFVLGFKAFRWLLNELGIKQPRSFKKELSSDFTIGTPACVRNGVDKDRETEGIDNWTLHKLLAGLLSERGERNC